jgi:hypothetical protein
VARVVRLPASACYAILAVAAGLARAPLLANHFHSIDEASYFAQAGRLHSLDAFAYAYLYRTETKTQVSVIPYLLAQLLAPAQAVLLVQIFALAAILGSGALLIAAARRWLGSPVIGLLAALIWIAFLEVGPGYPIPGLDAAEEFPAPLLEYWQAPCVLAAGYLALRAAESRGSRRAALGWALAGAAWAVAVLIKPPAVVLAPLLLAAPWALRVHAAQAAPARAWLRLLLAFSLGALLPVAAVFGPYLLRPDTWAEVRFNLVDVNTFYATVVPLPVRAAAMLLGLPPLLLLGWLGAPILARRAAAGMPGRLLAGIWLAGLLFFLGQLPGGGFPHYLIPVLPFLALATVGYGWWWLRGLAATGRPRRAGVLAALLLGAYALSQAPALLAMPAQLAPDRYLADDRQRFDLAGLVAYIQAHSAPDAAIWVYYNTPELYTLADRRPATRMPNNEYLIAYWREPWFTRTAADLAAEQPALIVGITDPRYARAWTTPLAAIPVVGDVIARDYRCDAGAVRGAVVCARTPPGTR